MNFARLRLAARSACGWFRLAEHGTTVRTELLAGVTTFLTMAYIAFVQPAVLSGRLFGAPTGLDFGAAATATCLSAAFASALMGLWARLPIAQAPGMGENFFFVLTAIPAAAAAGSSEPWRVALGAVFLSGVAFLVLTIVGVRRLLADAISPSLRAAIAGGIGLFVAFIGLRNAGVIEASPATAVALTHRILAPDALVFALGLLVAGALHARRVAGSILWGMLAATAAAICARLAFDATPDWVAATPAVRDSLLLTRFAFADGVLSAPPSLAPTFLALDVAGAARPAMAPLVLVFFLMVVLDATGTLVAVGSHAGLDVSGETPQSRRAFASDAIGTIAGALLGTSTVTSYVESAAGVEQGGRTGLTSVVVAVLFVLALFFSPVIAMVASYPPITAPALVLVGAMMVRSVAEIDRNDVTESLPAFLVLVGIPLSYAISDGLALGFVAQPLLKVLAGRAREVKPVAAGLALVLALWLAFLR
jgi:AGZA family xanthine/uracil permease-like MFS transporter